MRGKFVFAIFGIVALVISFYILGLNNKIMLFFVLGAFAASISSFLQENQIKGVKQ